MAEERTLDPERFEEFISELLDAGFVCADDDRGYTGRLPESLREFTDATEMTIIVHEPWPYRQPSVIVRGIDWWHAAHDAPCLWQPDDNTKRWLTLDGILGRIVEWAEHAKAGFATVDGAALDPQLYFPAHALGVVGLDIDDLIGRLDQDGQHGKVHLVVPDVGLIHVAPGSSSGREINGFWFYRAALRSPPRDEATFLSSLSDKQRGRLDKLLQREGRGLALLAWPTNHGTAVLPLVITADANGRDIRTLHPTPTSLADRRRRAGPDAEALAAKQVVLLGLGASGSFVASLLSRSGLGFLRAVDGDLKVPVGLVRHAFTGVGMKKVDEVRDELGVFDWTVVEPIIANPWGLTELADIISGADLCIDATGNSLFAELVSRVASRADVPFVSVALFRGGRVLRVRRQAPGDSPIVDRPGQWRYPAIPAAADQATDFLGAETGCAAAIHNAPPSAVTSAASVAALVAIDLLSGRRNYPDEVIDVLEPIDTPFNTLGRYRPEPPPVMLTESARQTLIAAARDTRPAETGGILIGARDDAGICCIVRAIEFRPDAPSPHRYTVPDGVTQAAVDAAHEDDDRLEYVGEWHSHPTDQPASPTDKATMIELAAQPEAGDPLLVVLRPMTSEQIHVDAYVVVNGSLAPTAIIDVGPLPALEEP